MTKHYCDRCGKEIQGIVRLVTDGEIYKVKVTLPGYSFTDVETEYCYDCLKQVVGEELVAKMDERRKEAKKRYEEWKANAEQRNKLKVEPSHKKESDLVFEDM